MASPMNATTQPEPTETTTTDTTRTGITISLDDTPELWVDNLTADLYGRFPDTFTPQARADAADLAVQALAARVQEVAGVIFWLPSSRRLRVAAGHPAARVRESLVAFVTDPAPQVIHHCAAKVA